MKSLVGTLENIGRKPHMFFRDGGSLRELDAFIMGFHFGQGSPGKDPEFGYFTGWVAARYRCIEGSMDWFSIVLEQAGGDDRRGFALFFELLPQYIRDLREIGPEGISARHAEATK
jgi:hypothetical protein